MRHEAIFLLYPNAQTVHGDVVYDTNEQIIVVDEDLVQQKTQELLSAYQAKQYARDRASAYKSIEEQLDMQYWDRVNGTDTWKQHIDAVKTAHPKPTE